jgi:biopolymer transport protein ExbD
MNRNTRKKRVIADINIAPFTDVILVLLVIFMVTTPLISESNIKINLPGAKNGEPAERNRQEHADITLTREGIVYLDGKIVTKKELSGRIKIMHDNNSDLGVTIRSDRAVKFQQIVNVLDILSEWGITKLNITAISEE